MPKLQETRKNRKQANRRQSRSYVLLSVLFAEGWSLIWAILGTYFIQPNYTAQQSSWIFWENDSLIGIRTEYMDISFGFFLKYFE